MSGLKVSIITVSYNASETIEKTICSVISQTYPNIEYIIIDGNSSDGTKEIIKKYEKHISTWISEPDNGIYDAMNKGIKLATGDIIGLLNSDDYYFNSEVISDIVGFYSKAEDNSIIHGNLMRLIKEKKFFLKPNNRENAILEGPAYLHPTMFVPRKLYQSCGLFDTKYQIAADYDLMLRLYLNGATFRYFDKTIVNMAVGGRSDNKRLKGFVESYNIALANGLNPIKSTYYFLKRVIISYTFSLTHDN